MKSTRMGALLSVAAILRCRRPPARRSRPASTLVVLGSGGHVAEMVKLLPRLPPARYGPIQFVAADTDTVSEQRAKARHVRESKCRRRASNCWERGASS